MRRVRAALIWCGVGLAASLMLGRVHPFGDAGLYGERGTEALLLSHGEVPIAVRAVLVEKCADCHSEQTRVPFYGRFAPASSVMERDIVEARKAMNLSQWDGYSADRQQTLAAKMAQEMKTHAMPPVQYRMIHWKARIADGDVEAVAEWTRGLQGSGFDSGAEAARLGDPARGKALFEKRCTGCHALNENHEGPRLQGVYGRTSGTAAGFAYSAALKKAAVVWDDQTLEKWLTDADAFIAGNDMDFLVSKPQERRDLISYLRQSSGAESR